MKQLPSAGASADPDVLFLIDHGWIHERPPFWLEHSGVSMLETFGSLPESDNDNHDQNVGIELAF